MHNRGDLTFCKARSSLVAAMILLLTLMPIQHSSHAATQIQNLSFNQPVATGVYDSFDPSRGSLTAAKFTVQGNVLITLDTPYNSDPIVGTSIPYFFQFGLEQQFDGRVTLVTPAHYLITSTATGATPTTSFTLNYSYAFTLNATTDLQGGIAPITFSSSGSPGVTAIPPPFASGKLASVTGPAGFDIQYIFTDLFEPDGTSSSSGPPVSYGEVAGPERVTVEYDYTVPEPATFAMLALCSICLALRPRRAALGEDEGTVTISPNSAVTCLREDKGTVTIHQIVL